MAGTSSSDELTGIVVSEEYVTLKVGEMTTIQAQVKPNGYVYDEGYIWEVEQSNVVGITEQDDGQRFLWKPWNLVLRILL